MKNNNFFEEAVRTLFMMQEVERLDLGMIKLKLQDSEGGPEWSKEQCDVVEVEYKRFLALKRLFPDKDLVPNRRTDKFWQQHILDTAKYAEDCNKVFGHFLHHYSYSVTSEKDKAVNLDLAFEETKRMYKKYFHEDYLGFPGSCMAPKYEYRFKPGSMSGTQPLR